MLEIPGQRIIVFLRLIHRSSSSKRKHNTTEGEDR